MDEAGLDEAHVDAPGAHLVVERFAGAFEGEFGGAVHRHGGHGHHAADGGDVDDAAAALLAHGGEDESRQFHGRAEVDAHLLDALFFGDVFDDGAVGDAEQRSALRFRRRGHGAARRR